MALPGASFEAVPPALSLASFFAGLPEAQKSAVMAAGRSVHYPEGASIHRRGDAGDSFSIVERGAVRFSRTDSEGETIVLATVGPGEAFGEISLFAGLPRAYDAEAVGPADIRALRRAELDELIAREPAIRDHLLRHITRQLVTVLDLLDDERRLPLPVRLAKLLWARTARAAAEGSQLVLPHTQAALAEELAVSRVAMSKAIARLAAAGLVATGYGRITVTDRAGLAEWIARHDPG